MPERPALGRAQRAAAGPTENVDGGTIEPPLVIMANYARSQRSRCDSVWPSGRPRRGTWTVDTTRDVTPGTPAQCRPPSPAPGLAHRVPGRTEGHRVSWARAFSGRAASELSERAAGIPSPRRGAVVAGRVGAARPRRLGLLELDRGGRLWLRDGRAVVGGRTSGMERSV
jgi:hypothetical protein